MNKKLLGLYGLKYNPFCQDVPVRALFISPGIEHFCWRVENQLGEGGFALITGAPGSGKSSVLRMLSDRLSNMCEVRVGILTRPQASVADLYRELGDLFGVTLSASNRWGGAKALRRKWSAHIEASLYRPVLIIDEAQAMTPSVLSELRMLSSTELDSRSILSVVLSGDDRLTKKLQSDELLPIASRIRCRLRCEAAESRSLKECLGHRLKEAGNPRLIDEAVVDALCEHAAGNYRCLMNMANDLLAAAIQREAEQINQKLFFEVFDIKASSSRRRKP